MTMKKIESMNRWASLALASAVVACCAAMPGLNAASADSNAATAVSANTQQPTRIVQPGLHSSLVPGFAAAKAAEGKSETVDKANKLAPPSAKPKAPPPLVSMVDVAPDAPVMAPAPKIQQPAVPAALSVKPADAASAAPVKADTKADIKTDDADASKKSGEVCDAGKKPVVAKKRIVKRNASVVAVAANEPAFAELKSVDYAPDSQGNELAVSDREMNTFTFSSPIYDLLTPPGSALGKPTYLPGNKTVVLTFQKGATQAIQALFVFKDGTSRQLYLKPRPQPGIFWADKQNTQAPVAGDSGVSSADSDVEVLKRLVQDERSMADEFVKIPLPSQAEFTDYTLVPTGAWFNGSDRRVFRFAVVAKPGKQALLASPQFYRDGITVVLLDGEITDSDNTPSLYVVEAVNPAQ